MPGDERRATFDGSWVLCFVNVALAVVFSLFLFPWFELTRITQEFDIELPSLTVWLQSSLSLFVVPCLGAAAFVKEFVLKDKRQRLVTNVVLLFASAVIFGLFVVGLAWPLIRLLNDLS
jgi:hypothetical protein